MKPTEPKLTFARVLNQYGFKRSGFKQYANTPNVKIYSTKGGDRYAELFNCDGYKECWVTGKGIPCGSTISYPGGITFFTPETLLNCLKNIL